MANTSTVPRQCLEIVRPFADQLDDLGVSNVQFFGGVGSAALEHLDVEIRPDEKLIVVPADAMDDLGQYREDGTLRDLDCLVKSIDQNVIDGVEEIAGRVIPRGDLELSFFGLKPMSRLGEQRERPVLSIAKVHLSDRYVLEEKGSIVVAKKALYPFVVDMPAETLETWRLQIGKNGNPLPVPHPGATILNYLTRSVSGLRPKDAAKVDSLTSNIARVAPEIIDWIVDGPGASQLDLARILHTLRVNRKETESLVVGDVLEIAPYDLQSLVKHNAFGDFMVAGRPRLLRGLIEVEHVKSRGLHCAEKRQKIVTVWQGHAEGHVQKLVKND